MVFSTPLRPTDEGFPGLRVLALSPGMRPAHHHRVGCHPPQTAGLDHVTDAFTRLLSHDALAEALHTLLIHQVLQSLNEDMRVQGVKATVNSGV